VYFYYQSCSEARERAERRQREADAERAARLARGSPKRRRRRYAAAAKGVVNGFRSRVDAEA
jgi:hypothetical protein